MYGQVADQVQRWTHSQKVNGSIPSAFYIMNHTGAYCDSWSPYVSTHLCKWGKFTLDEFGNNVGNQIGMYSCVRKPEYSIKIGHMLHMINDVKNHN